MESRLSENFKQSSSGDAKFPTVLICDVDIGADIDHLEVVIHSLCHSDTFCTTARAIMVL